MTAVAAVACLTSAPVLAEDPLSRVTLTVTPTYTISTNAAQGAFHTSSLRLNYAADIALTRALTLFYTHDNVDFTFDQPLIGGQLAAVPAKADRIDTVGLSYGGFRHNIVVNAGYFNRTRMCCPSDAQSPSSGIGYHGEFVGGGVSFGPLLYSGRMFNYSVRALYVSHPATPSNQLDSTNTAVPYGSNKFIFPMTLAMNIPVRSKTFIPFVAYSKGADYFHFDPGPEYYNTVIVGFVKVINPRVVLHGAVVNLKEQHQPYPFSPDFVRVTVVNLALDFKIHR